MSQDFGLQHFREGFTQLAWRSEKDLDLPMLLRLLNAPLPKLTIALSFAFADIEPQALPRDWNWAESWSGNSASIPTAPVLLMARAPMAIAFAATSVCAFLFGLTLGRSRVVGVIAAVLVQFNPLLLLHSRRAMAESLSILFAFITVLLAIHIARQLKSPLGLKTRIVWAVMLGACVALAIASKQTGIVLIPVAVAACWHISSPRENKSTLVITYAAMLAVLIGVTWLLNPVIHREPVTGFQRMITERQVMATAQASAPGVLALTTPAARAAAMLDIAFFDQPRFMDTDSYSADVAPFVDKYQASFWHSVLRGRIWSLIAAALAAIGLVALVWRFRELESAIFLLYLLLTASFLIVGIPLRWQRYFIPIVPIINILTALGLGYIIRKMRYKLQSDW